MDVTVTLDYAVKATHVRLIAYDVGSTDKHVAISEMKVYEAEPFDLQSIQITTPPTKTEYLPTEVGTVDTTGMVVKGSYADGTVCEIASADLEIGTLSATEGTQSVTVSYGGKSTSYDVVVKSEVTKLKETLLEKIQALQAQIDLEVYDNEYLNNVLAEAETVYKEATELAAVQAQIDALDALTYTFKTDAEATGVYLSDLEWVSDSAPLASGGHTHKDEHQSGATPIRLTDATGEEVEFKKGLGSHAAQTTVYNLNGEYDIFESYIGVDNAAGEFNGVIFKVYVDCLPTDEGAKPVYTSKVLNRGDAMEHLLVDVKGANKLVLVADSNGDVSGDHADWAAARLYTNYKLDVTEFKSGETVTCPEAPAGQVFAGWFNEKAFATAYKQGTGSAWPKFIDEEVLSTKIQCSAGAEVGDPNTNMRFITTVDDLNYSSVGFEITINDITLQKNSTTVYEKIYANIGSTTEEKSPDTFYEDSKFFFTYIINNIPQVGFDNDIVVIPYVVTLDGTTSYGVERTLTVASHLASIAEPAN